MNSRDLSRLMWSEALSLLDQADRLRRQFVRPVAGRAPAWEPPVDIVETAEQVRVTVALPGVEPEAITISLDADAARITARRDFPLNAAESEGRARIHALEIPHGRFERRIAIPARALTLVEQYLHNGCLTLIFSRKEAS